MRVLVVNAHASSQEGKKSFNRFLECVKLALESCSSGMDMDDSCIIRTKEDIDDFLFVDQGSHHLTDAGKRFDALDMILVSGDTSMLPWSPSAYKVVALIKMCLRVNKYLFACGSAMEILVFLSASNLENPIRVINGKGKGSKIGEINSVKIPPNSIRSEMDCFLDAITGDLYTLRHESQEWIPFCNIGLHNVRLAQEYNTLGKYVIQVPVYRPKKALENKLQANCFFESYEVMCYLKKNYSNHWLFSDCSLEFTVPHRSKWNIHSFIFVNEEKSFEVMADSDDGPFIIEYPNIIGVKFEIDQKYPETKQILANYIAKCSRDIITRGNDLGPSILKESAVNFSRFKRFIYKGDQEPKLGDNGNSTISKWSIRSGSTKTSRAGTPLMRHGSMGQLKELKLTDEDGRSSGFTFKKKGIPINRRNFASNKSPEQGYESPNHGRAFPKPNNRSSLLLKKYDPLDGPVFQKNLPSYKGNHLELKGFEHYKGEEHESDRAIGILKTHQGFKALGILNAIEAIHNDPVFSNNFTSFNGPLSRENIRKFLYPDLPDLRNTFDKKSWVPGNLSSRHKRQASEGKKVKIATFSDTIETKFHSPKVKGFRENLDLNPYKTLRTSTPYTTFSDIQKEYRKKEDQKILGNKVFITSTKGSPPNLRWDERTSSTERTGFNASLTGRY